MRKEYDFGTMKGQKNPYIKDLKTQVTIRLDSETVAYFKSLAKKTGMPYQNLINLYLRECAEMKKEPTIRWMVMDKAKGR
jgi:predicted DNA binding CopG/RHH family protein